MEEIEVKSVSDTSSEKNEDILKNESSLEIIGVNKRVNIISTLNDTNNPGKPTKTRFKKLERSDKDESDHKTKIVYPANFFNSLSFNWLYDVIKNRTEDNPVKLS